MSDGYVIQVTRAILRLEAEQRARTRQPGRFHGYAFIQTAMERIGAWVAPEARLDEMERQSREAIAKKVRMVGRMARPKRHERVVAHIVTPSDPDFASGRLLGPDGQPIGGS